MTKILKPVWGGNISLEKQIEHAVDRMGEIKAEEKAVEFKLEKLRQKEVENNKRGAMEEKKGDWSDGHDLDREEKDTINRCHLGMMNMQMLPYLILPKAKGCYCVLCRLCVLCIKYGEERAKRLEDEENIHDEEEPTPVLEESKFRRLIKGLQSE